MAPQKAFLKRLLLGLPIICLGTAFLLVFIYAANQSLKKPEKFWASPGSTLEAYLMGWLILCIFLCLIVIFGSISYIFSGQTFCIMFRSSETSTNNTQDSKTDVVTV